MPPASYCCCHSARQAAHLPPWYSHSPYARTTVGPCRSAESRRPSPSATCRVALACKWHGRSGACIASARIETWSVKVAAHARMYIDEISGRGEICSVPWSVRARGHFCHENTRGTSHLLVVELVRLRKRKSAVAVLLLHEYCSRGFALATPKRLLGRERGQDRDDQKLRDLDDVNERILRTSDIRPSRAHRIHPPRRATRTSRVDILV